MGLDNYSKVNSFEEMAVEEERVSSTNETTEVSENKETESTVETENQKTE